jgi:hypothetical protein
MKEILLTQGYKASVDDNDYDYLNKFSWCLLRSDKCLYAQTRIRSKSFVMHRLLIQNVPDGYVIHHKDNNGLNNQRSNLEVVTHSYNCVMARVSKVNKLKIRGISKLRHLGYVPHVWVGKKISLGTYKTIEVAVEVRNKFIMDNNLNLQLSVIPKDYERNK